MTRPLLSFSIFILLFSFLFSIQSCATGPKTIMRKDPLIGKIIDTRSHHAIEFESLINDIQDYDVIYLSEKHNNPEHHLIQQKIIHGLIEKNKAPVIGFEFFSMDNTPDLLNFIDSGNVSHSKKNQGFIENDLRKKTGWDNQSDAMWQYYYDLLQIARDQKLVAAGLDLPSTLKRRITRKGMDGLTPIEKEQIFSSDLSDSAYKSYMFSVFNAVHCGMGHGKMESRLWDTWVARNDKMALSIERITRHYKGPLVVIMGGGHTEYGLGVIDRVKAIDSNIQQVNIGLQEIRITPTGLPGYLTPPELKGYENTPPADYLWFTQRVSYADPCEEFKKSLKKMRELSKKTK